MSLLTELDAFYLDHRQCGELDAGVEGPIIWMTCSCGASAARRDLAVSKPPPGKVEP